MSAPTPVPSPADRRDFLKTAGAAAAVAGTASLASARTPP